MTELQNPGSALDVLEANLAFLSSSFPSLQASVTSRDMSEKMEQERRYKQAVKEYLAKARVALVEMNQLREVRIFVAS